jgi:hypothetical protein
MTKNQKIILLLLLFIAIAMTLFSFHPIAQDLHYHNFADKRALFGINNFGDAVSNIPYILVGILGFLVTLRFRNDSTKFANKVETIPFLLAFFGIFLVGFGSGYYHLNPNNHTLVWDRLPMTIGFMAIFSIIISERINLKAGLYLLPLFLALGIASIIYWNYTESFGQGDLRPYVLVQFFPLLAIPLIIYLFPAKYSGTRYLGEIIFWYVVAKILEYFDWQIFDLTHHLVSGHSLKHLASAIATYALVRYVKFRHISPS